MADQVTENVCEVWWARRSHCRPTLVGLLSEAERTRWAALRQAADQQRFVVGAALIRTVAGRLLGISPGAVRLERTCPDCDRPHGKPRVVGGPEVSLSHSGDHVAVAVHPTAPVGVDVEQVNRALDPLTLAPLALGDQEAAHLRTLPAEDRPAAFATYWVRKEAIVKATGEGLRTPLRTLTVSAPHEPARLLGDDAVQLHDLVAGSGYAAALAVLTASPVTVLTLDAGPLLDGYPPPVGPP